MKKIFVIKMASSQNQGEYKANSATQAKKKSYKSSKPLI